MKQRESQRTAPTAKLSQSCAHQTEHSHATAAACPCSPDSHFVPGCATSRALIMLLDHCASQFA
eukprot:scaffold319413_cov24-Tisochrysis_lutea.AAC.2